MMRARWLSRLLTITIYALVILALVVSLFPIFWFFLTSIKPRDLTFAIPPAWIFTPTFDNYAAVLSDRQFLRYLLNSLIIAGGTTGIALASGLLAGYALARYKFRGNGAFRFLFLLPQITPSVAILVPLFVLFNGLDLTNTHLALILANLTLTMPLAIWMLIGFFEDSPIDLEESAMIDGCSRLGALARVVLPVIAPGLAAAAALCFIYSWNEFLYASILSGRDTRTLSVAITSFLTNRAIDWGRTAAAGSLILLPVLVFALFTQRYLVRGLSHGAVKG
jgi:multiple sugar transport system permease protein